MGACFGQTGAPAGIPAAGHPRTALAIRRPNPRRGVINDSLFPVRPWNKIAEMVCLPVFPRLPSNFGFHAGLSTFDMGYPPNQVRLSTDFGKKA